MESKNNEKRARKHIPANPRHTHSELAFIGKPTDKQRKKIKASHLAYLSFMGHLPRMNKMNNHTKNKAA
jgi:hypothetical protein